MPRLPPSAYTVSMFPPDEFVDLELRPVGAARDKETTEHNLQSSRPGKKNARWWCHHIIIILLIAIITALGGLIIFLVTNPGVLGTPCPAQLNLTQHPVTQTQSHNAAMTSIQLATKTRPRAQATSTHSGVDPVAVASCLGVLEDACARENPPTTFGQCDPLFVFFYCDLTDMMVFRGAMKLDADGSSPVCPSMKEFCSRAILLNRIPLADVSP
ncbi:hypothetical protein MFRU_001g04060 [Monilinia fructicola]|nr:hypothetical protein MFRU_001g04060 [Monilinia fructicola]